jgi:hypothetical protein
MRSNDWSLALSTNDGVDLEMTIIISDFIEQLKRTINPIQIVGHVSPGNLKNFKSISKNKLTL